MSDDPILTPAEVEEQRYRSTLGNVAASLRLADSHEKLRAQLAALGQGWQLIETAPMSETPRLVKVPDIKPKGGLCWKQNIRTFVRCIFKAKHAGRHSWQKEPDK